MIVTYCRSSSYGGRKFCEHKFFLEYFVGLKDKTNKKAQLGTITHKVMELLARIKVAFDRKEDRFEDEHFGTLKIDSLSLEDCLHMAWDHYVDSDTHNEYDEKDLETVCGWVDDALSYGGGIYNPLNRDILEIEKQFDVELEWDWARYNYPEHGISGKFAIKGTIDLITLADPDTIEVVDYKTGSRRDWATGKVKEYEDMTIDPQLLIYSYALNKMYPDKHVLITLFFIRDGGAFTIPFGKEMDAASEILLKEFFGGVRKTLIPKRTIDDPVNKWKCFKLCGFHKDGTCKKYHDLLKTNHIDSLVNISALTTYGDAAGRRREDTKD